MGQTSSFGAGSNDIWVLKLDSTGSVQWQKTYGGAGNDIGYSVEETGDGGHVVAGFTTSFGAGGSDLWLLRLDSSGGVLWQRTYGGPGDEYGDTVRRTSSGGLVVAASLTTSYGAGGDAWVLRLDGNGNVDPAAGQCTIISTTSVNGVDSSASVSGTSVAGPASAGISATTFAVGMDAQAVTNTQCWASLCATPGFTGTLSVSRAGTATTVSWTAGGASLFDVLRGDLGTLAATAEDFGASLDAISPPADVCLADDTAALSVVDGRADPNGGGEFYLLRPVASCGSTGTYNSGSVYQVGDRDPEIFAAAHGCP